MDPYTITLDEAIAILEQKKQADEPIHVFGEIQVLNGKYGAYIKTPQGNYRIPKNMDVLSLTEDACRKKKKKSEPTSGKRRYSRKK